MEISLVRDTLGDTLVLDGISSLEVESMGELVKECLSRGKKKKKEGPSLC